MKMLAGSCGNRANGVSPEPPPDPLAPSAYRQRAPRVRHWGGSAASAADITGAARGNPVDVCRYLYKPSK
jgi:hypothetical protein